MTYTPKPGSLPFKVLEFLRSQPAGKEFTAAQIASALGLRVTSSLPHKLDGAAHAGLVVIRASGPRCHLYSLGVGRRQEEDDDLPVRQRVVPACGASSIFTLADQLDAAGFSPGLSEAGAVTLRRNGEVIEELTQAEARALAVWVARNLSAFVPRQVEVAA